MTDYLRNDQLSTIRYFKQILQSIKTEIRIVKNDYEISAEGTIIEREIFISTLIGLCEFMRLPPEFVKDVTFLLKRKQLSKTYEKWIINEKERPYYGSVMKIKPDKEVDNLLDSDYWYNLLHDKIDRSYESSFKARRIKISTIVRGLLQYKDDKKINPGILRACGKALRDLGVAVDGSSRYRLLLKQNSPGTHS